LRASVKLQRAADARLEKVGETFIGLCCFLQNSN
jgi:hypothetical protein